MAYISTHETKRSRGKPVKTYAVVYRTKERADDDCCRALKLPTMPSLSMHTKHGVVRRRDDGVLDMMVPHLQRGNGDH
jgi:hypothetical protein